MITALIAVLTTGCATATAPPTGPRSLAGQWNGWMMIGRLGNGPATMTVSDDGAFDGVLRLEVGDSAFRGAITVIGWGTMRYDSTFGDGMVSLTESSGEATLKLVPDGGGGVATFVRTR